MFALIAVPDSLTTGMLAAVSNFISGGIATFVCVIMGIPLAFWFIEFLIDLVVDRINEQKSGVYVEPAVEYHERFERVMAGKDIIKINE